MMKQNAEIINKAKECSLEIIEQDREREIISRRFGLDGKKQTLEEIGKLLDITRERVRQLEKAILVRLRIASEDGLLPEVAAAEKIIIRYLIESGRTARIDELAKKIYGREATEDECSVVCFLSSILTNLTMLSENDRYYTTIGIAEYGDEREIRKKIDLVVQTIKDNGEAISMDELFNRLDGYEHPDYIEAIAKSSKRLASLSGKWGLSKWSSVNPRNIRDKIFFVLTEAGKPMHFSEIAKAIAESNFSKKNVTVQAIHNELIKDPRFVLIGRGIYALNTWGYTRGTVTDIIKTVLKEAGKPLTREQIVREVLKKRKVKETTVLLSLQNRSLFKKVDSNLFELA